MALQLPYCHQEAGNVMELLVFVLSSFVSLYGISQTNTAYGTNHMGCNVCDIYFRGDP